jgi:hypothetical protein
LDCRFIIILVLYSRNPILVNEYIDMYKLLNLFSYTFIKVVVLIGVLFWGSCRSGKHEIYTKVQYEQTLQQIANNLVELTTPDEPISYPPFRTLYQHADWYVMDAINVLQSRKSTVLMKRLAIYNMQGVSKIDDYLTFFEALIEEFEKGNIDEDLCLDAMGVPPYIIFLEYYKHDREQVLLNRLSQCPRSSAHLRGYITDILSGKALETALEWW